MVQNSLGIEAQLFCDLRGGLLFEEVEAKDGSALTGEFLYLVEDVLEHFRLYALRLVVVVGLGAEIGDFGMAFALAGAETEVIDGFVADDDVQPTFNMLNGPHAG